MRKTKLIAAATLAAAVTLPTAAPAAKPKLDTSFGAHHGFWVRTDGPWASAYTADDARGGAAYVATGDGYVMRVKADGRPDETWAGRGVLDVAGSTAGSSGRQTWAIATQRWSGRPLFVAQPFYSGRAPRVVVTGSRGNRLPVSDVVNAALPPYAEHQDTRDTLTAMPDGTLWDLRQTLRYPPAFGQGSYTTADALIRLTAAGAPIGTPTTIAPGLLSGPTSSGGSPWRATVGPRPVPSGKGLLVPLYDTLDGSVLKRFTADGRVDPTFRPVPFHSDDGFLEVLPWHGGAIVHSTRYVRWIDRRGRVVHRRSAPVYAHIALDTAGRVLLAGWSVDTRRTITLRRFRTDATLDTGFGVVKLRAPGRQVEALGVVASSGGRIVVIGRTMKLNQDFLGRDDVDHLPVGTIAWRVRTR